MSETETWEQFAARLDASRAAFDRRQERRRRLWAWGVVPYGAGGALVGVGTANTFEAHLRGTALMLTGGFVTMTLFHWVVPVALHRFDRKDPPDE